LPNVTSARFCRNGNSDSATTCSDTNWFATCPGPFGRGLPRELEHADRAVVLGSDDTEANAARFGRLRPLNDVDRRKPGSCPGKRRIE
jgi:hypothetical protein